MDWLLRTHPSLEKGETREHWLLPTLTVLVTGIALYTLPNSPLWWLGFGLGAVIFLVVALSEFVVVDPNDARYPLATAILTVFAFVIFLILAVVLKAANVRLIWLVPALFLAGGLAALRTLHLRLNERWEFAWAAGIGLVVDAIGRSPALPAIDAGALWAGAAGSALRADRAVGQPGGGQSLPAGIPRAGSHAGPVLGVGGSGSGKWLKNWF